MPPLQGEAYYVCVASHTLLFSEAANPSVAGRAVATAESQVSATLIKRKLRQGFSSEDIFGVDC